MPPCEILSVKLSLPESFSSILYMNTVKTESTYNPVHWIHKNQEDTTIERFFRQLAQQSHLQEKQMALKILLVAFNQASFILIG